MANEGILVSGDPSVLLTEINTELAQRPISPSTVASQLCWMRGGSIKTIGQKVIYSLPFPGNRWEIQSIYEEIGGTLPELVKFSQILQMWGPKPTLIPKLTEVTDLYGILEENSQPLIADAQIELERQLAELIGTGTSIVTDYDGLSFFNAAHECNPNRPGLKQFSNYRTSFACNATNIATALDDLDAVPGPTGGLFSMPGQNYIFVSNGAQEKTALEAMNGELNAVKVASGDTAGVGVSNAGLIGRAKVVKLTQLRNYGSNKLWGVARIANAKHRPFVLSMAMPPTMYIEGLSIDEHSQTTRNVSKQGIKSVHGLGYLWPQLAELCVEP